MKAVAAKMDLSSAGKIIDHNRLPGDVSDLVQIVAHGIGFCFKFGEDPLDMARIAYPLRTPHHMMSA